MTITYAADTYTPERAHQPRSEECRQPNTASDALPRLLPTPGPTESASVSESLQLDFDRTDQPYWANEQIHQDTPFMITMWTLVTQ